MEPVFIHNCKGFLGLAGDEPIFLPYSQATIDEHGLSYRGNDRSGYVIDCQGSLALQSFFNSHTHAAMTLFRGMGDDSHLQQWLSSIWEMEAKLDREAVSLGAEKAIIEFLLTGTTGFIDMYFYEDETVAKAWKYGLKILTGPTIMGGEIGIGEIERRLIEFREKTRSFNNVKPVLNLHSIYTVSPRVFRELGETGVTGDPLIHIHVSETKEEVISSLRRFGVTPIEFLARNNVLGEKTVLVHLGWITSREIELISRARPWLVHCPASNMKLATGGFFPLKDLLDKGYKKLLLGTDGPASNDTLHILEEARLALLLSRNNYWSTEIKPRDTLSMAWRGWMLYDPRKACILEKCRPDLYISEYEPTPTKNIIDSIVTNPFSLTPWTLIYDKGVMDEESFKELSLRNKELAYRIKEKTENMIAGQ